MYVTFNCRTQSSIAVASSNFASTIDFYFFKFIYICISLEYSSVLVKPLSIGHSYYYLWNFINGIKVNNMSFTTFLTVCIRYKYLESILCQYYKCYCMFVWLSNKLKKFFVQTCIYKTAKIFSIYEKTASASPFSHLIKVIPCFSIRSVYQMTK